MRQFDEHPCEGICPIRKGGFCPRHKVDKSMNLVVLCWRDKAYFQAWEEGRGPRVKPAAVPPTPKRRELPKRHVRKTDPPLTPRHPGLGDRVSQALSLVGITEERVSKWLGRPCGCAKRREKLNQLGAWAARVIGGQSASNEESVKHLDEIIDQ